MRLIDADRLSEIIYENVPAPYEDSREAKEECLMKIEKAVTVDAVPVSELIMLRDTLYRNGGLSIEGVVMLNQLIAKYGRPERSNTIPNEGRWLETR